MKRKSILCILIIFLIFLAVQPFDLFIGTTRAFEIYYMDDPPPQDENGNFTLDGENGWIIFGKGSINGNITAKDEAIIAIEHANVTIKGSIWASDKAKIIIRSSIVRMEVPAGMLVLIENQYDYPNGFVLFEQMTSLLIEDSYVHISRHDIQEPGQEIPEGMMLPGEIIVSFGKFTLKDSILNTSSTISDGSIIQSVNRGMVTHGNCELEIIDSTFTSGFRFQMETHGIIENTTFRSISMRKSTDEQNLIISNSTITHTSTLDQISIGLFYNCTLKSLLIVTDRAVAVLKDTTVGGLRLQKNGTVIMQGSEFSAAPIYPNWNHVWDNSSLILRDSSYIRFVYCSDNSSISLFNSSMESIELKKNVSITIEDSYLEDLCAEEDSTVWIQDSEFGQYHMYHNAKIYNISTLTVSTKLNKQPLKVNIKVKDSMGETLATSETNEYGITEFTMIMDMLSINVTSNEIEYTKQNTSCIVEVEYENLHKEVTADIDNYYIKVEMELEDYKAPKINNIHYEIEPFLSLEKEIIVSANVKDSETSLQDVFLRYSIDDGRTWENMPMYEIDQGKYEISIPKQKSGTKVRFYISAVDKSGNAAESKYYTLTVGEDEVLLYNLMVITLIILVIGLLGWITIKVYRIKNRRRTYIRKTETSEK
jgi:hypothetical protein